MLEHGPLKVSFAGGKDRDGAVPQNWTLEANPYAWSEAASVVYIDSPAGVGMSYSETPADYSTNDTRTISDLGEFVAGFLERHPRFSKSPIFLAGESYAGVYVPLLARELLRRGDAAKRLRPHFGGGADEGAFAISAAGNLKGYLVGNPVTDALADGLSLPDFAVGMALIPPALGDIARRVCAGVDISSDASLDAAEAAWGAGGTRSRVPLRAWLGLAGAAARDPLAAQGADKSACRRVTDLVFDLLAGINKYGILDGCYAGGNPYLGDYAGGNPHLGDYAGNASGVASAAAAARLAAPGARRGVAGLTALGAAARAAPLQHTPGCLDSREMFAFANHPAVREAIHARQISEIGAFDECTNGDRIDYTVEVSSVTDVHAELVARGLRAIAYSGDHDAIIPHVGTRNWTAELGLRVSSPWMQWRLDNGDVGGFFIAYEGLTFATVMGAGHAVAQSKPEAALTLFSRFLSGKGLGTGAFWSA